MTITTKTSIDVSDLEVYKRITFEPTNPYLLYNNADRILNAGYRYWTSGGLEKRYDNRRLVFEMPIAVDPIVRASALFQYERQSNMLAQHYWATAAVLGVGYSAARPDLYLKGDDPGHKKAIAIVILSRSIVNALAELALHVVNPFRYAPTMLTGSWWVEHQGIFPMGPNFPSPSTFNEYMDLTNTGPLPVRKVTIKHFKAWTSTATSAVFALNAMAATGLQIKILYNAINVNKYENDTDRSTAIAQATLSMLASAAGVRSTPSEELGCHWHHRGPRYDSDGRKHRPKAG